jgi:hypothetical protein
MVSAMYMVRIQYGTGTAKSHYGGKINRVMSPEPPTPQQHERYGIGDDGLGGSLYDLL